MAAVTTMTAAAKVARVENQARDQTSLAKDRASPARDLAIRARAARGLASPARDPTSPARLGLGGARRLATMIGATAVT
jgi:hypothetical protein